jgi:O6-methylguanine-DNA--protein-cysteine methyltransferase
MGAKGQLTGHDGGLSHKQWLLEFERLTLQISLFS